MDRGAWRTTVHGVTKSAQRWGASPHTLGARGGRGSPACCSPWSGKGSDTTQCLSSNNTHWYSRSQLADRIPSWTISIVFIQKNICTERKKKKYLPYFEKSDRTGFWYHNILSFLFILFDVPWASWICSLASLTNFVKFSVHNYSNIYFALFSLFFLLQVFQFCIPFVAVPHILDISVHLAFIFVFSSCFSLESCYWAAFKFTHYFLSCEKSSKPVKGFCVVLSLVLALLLVLS